MAYIRRTKIRQKPTSAYHVEVVVADDSTENEVETVEVLFHNMSYLPLPTSRQIILTLDNIRDSGSKMFVFKKLGFSRSPIGFFYPVTFTMKNAKNRSVGKPITLALAVEILGRE